MDNKEIENKIFQEHGESANARSKYFMDALW
jgi:hypothetical protein